MAFLVGGANSAVSGYDIDNSLRFNSASTEYLTDTGLGTATSTKIGTLSVWCKLSGYTIGGSNTNHGCFITGFVDSNNYLYFKHQDYDDTGRLHMRGYLSGSQNIYLETTRILRDPSAWYHVVAAWDTTDSTEANRMKIYVNNEQITSWTQDTFPAEDALIRFNSSERYIGTVRKDANYYNMFSGYMADYNIVDGLQLTPSNFGEADDSGIWKPKEPDVSEYGTNGIFLEFKETGTDQDSGGMGADTSGKDNHLAIGNLAADSVVVDTPTNNFATFNSLYAPTASKAIYSEGNTKAVTAAVSANTNFGGATTIGMSNGKWYCEFKVTIDDSAYTNGRTTVGITSNPAEDVRNHYQGGNQAHQWSYNSYNGQYRNSGSDNAYGDVYDDNDIISIALDLDNNKLYFAKNGTWQNSGDPTTGATGTGAISITALGSGEAYHFEHSGNTSSATISTASANFGNPAYANSSDAADANGYGAFEYAPPSGYYALCTKNLAEYG